MLGNKSSVRIARKDIVSAQADMRWECDGNNPEVTMPCGNCHPSDSNELIVGSD